MSTTGQSQRTARHLYFFDKERYLFGGHAQGPCDAAIPTLFRRIAALQARVDDARVCCGRIAVAQGCRLLAIGGYGLKMDWSTSEPRTGRAVEVTVTRRAALMDDLGARIAVGRGFALATLNLDHVVKLRRLPDFRAAYARHTHVTADGNPIVWLERLAGRRVELVPGSELVEPVAELCARSGVTVTLVGATETALSGAATALERRHPGLTVALRHAPPMGFDPVGPLADAAIAAIRSSGAGVCFLALGAPKQEIFAARAHAALPHVGFLSIGAGLDFIAGTQRRAPPVVQRLAVEWLWRLGRNPRRLWGRYAACFAALPHLTLAALKARQRRDLGQGAE